MEQGKRKPGLVKEVTKLSSFPNTATSLGEENRFDKGNITLAKETLIPMRKPTIVGSMGREQRTGAEIFILKTGPLPRHNWANFDFW